MFFGKTLLVGALVMGSLSNLTAQNVSASNESHDSFTHYFETIVRTSDAIQYMQDHGQRRTVTDRGNPLIRTIVDDARPRLEEQRVECVISRVSRMVLSGSSPETVLGYEVGAFCEDAPSPAIGLYYDTQGRYLGLRSLVR